MPVFPGVSDVPEVFVGVLFGTAAFIAGSLRTHPQR
jgi:hypothetical protein